MSTSKAIIPKDEWDRRLEEVVVSKADLNRLVMDYLVIEGYKSAAEEFSLEAGVQPAVDFASIESRRNIREALNRGDVQEAITRVNDLNPEPFVGGDDHAKPSVFKMIALPPCFRTVAY